MQKKIGVFDSGAGGLTTLSEIRKILPEAQLLYFGDTQNCPYGERDPGELLALTREIVAKLQRAGAEIIVIACNTATTQCIKNLRAEFPDLIFVGTEPALKVACDRGCQNILLMATPNTLGSQSLERLREKHLRGQKLHLFPCAGLAEMVERAADYRANEVLSLAPQEKMNLRINLNTEIREKLRALLQDIPERAQIDAVVLGCTHYIYLAEEIRKYFPHAQIFDGNAGVARRVQSLLMQ